MKRLDAIVIAVAALWLIGALASFWRGSDASFVVAGFLAAGVVLLLATWVARRSRR